MSYQELLCWDPQGHPNVEQFAAMTFLFRKAVKLMIMLYCNEMIQIKISKGRMWIQCKSEENASCYSIIRYYHKTHKVRKAHLSLDVLDCNWVSVNDLSY